MGTKALNADQVVALIDGGGLDGHLGKVLDSVDRRLVKDRIRWRVTWQGRDWTVDDLRLATADHVQKATGYTWGQVNVQLGRAPGGNASYAIAILTAICVVECAMSDDEAAAAVAALRTSQLEDIFGWEEAPPKTDPPT